MQGQSGIRYAAMSDLGRRDRNEDAFVTDRVAGYHIFAVADGLGGHASGDVASRMAVEILAEVTGEGFLETEPAALLERAFQRANTEICTYNREHRLNAGTTLSAAIVGESGRCWIGTVGDSRTHIITPSSIWHTRDQSYVQGLVESGMLSPAEAMLHPKKNILTQALGLAPRLQVDLDLVELAGAVLVISSDGLHDSVPASTIQEIVLANEPDAACRQLIDAARAAASTDNITVIVVRDDRP
ncbi:MULTISPECIES: protein phosphatase 2C domain-containing protein [unclassified Methanoculleus]|uniref:PP2C family protein-serine/threonine phosphatase n=1 Tax=unclassified Methanoculleus TaxID=2619537 RepID=UPI0025FDBD8A|nr:MULTISPECIES: protein phosphatase 2C domain-containing protein [unclassified Methanoculleus]MCK9317214.1 protein phosphatase 2C domain-containing protein [Methanoculleus sp.]MDD2253206.1 protein phosphatase 2C domain-containing protein [Methanoculleus sp.]MDD2788219.1 protein phosphatase 2C domain-containing protein [Methanoculleus sp.]MDD3215773.1 protein phosphatase 2C domain-containing protein [Methanoculleus sp.]MDD4313791.1 protein phosphatase 2C domain-containing protein [Methanoculle